MRAFDAQAFETMTLDERFTYLYDSYQQPIAIRLRTLTHNYLIAEDLHQETFFKVWRYLPHLKSNENLYGWIFLIATNVARDWKRKTLLRESIGAASLDLMQEANDGNFDVTDHKADFTDLVARKEIRAHVYSGLNKGYKATLMQYVNHEPVDMELVHIARRGYKDHYKRLMRKEAAL